MRTFKAVLGLCLVACAFAQSFPSYHRQVSVERFLVPWWKIRKGTFVVSPKNCGSTKVKELSLGQQVSAVELVLYHLFLLLLRQKLRREKRRKNVQFHGPKLSKVHWWRWKFLLSRTVAVDLLMISNKWSWNVISEIDWCVRMIIY